MYAGASKCREIYLLCQTTTPPPLPRLNARLAQRGRAGMDDVTKGGRDEWISWVYAAERGPRARRRRTRPGHRTPPGQGLGVRPATADRDRLVRRLVLERSGRRVGPALRGRRQLRGYRRRGERRWTRDRALPPANDRRPER